jgi:mono/diheme cytochrome c family protein
MYRSAILAALAMALSSGAALGAEPGDSARGLSYAKKFCAGCHGVEAKDQSSPNSEAPTFKSVANSTGMSSTALALWMQKPHLHHSMPEVVVPIEDRENVIAYILSLKVGATGGEQ